MKSSLWSEGCGYMTSTRGEQSAELHLLHSVWLNKACSRATFTFTAFACTWVMGLPLVLGSVLMYEALCAAETRFPFSSLRIKTDTVNKAVLDKTRLCTPCTRDASLWQEVSRLTDRYFKYLVFKKQPNVKQNSRVFTATSGSKFQAWFYLWPGCSAAHVTTSAWSLSGFQHTQAELPLNATYHRTCQTKCFK